MSHDATKISISSARDPRSLIGYKSKLGMISFVETSAKYWKQFMMECSMLRKLSGFYQNILSWFKCKFMKQKVFKQQNHFSGKTCCFQKRLIPTCCLYLEKNLDLLFVWLSRFSFSEEISSPSWKCISCKYITHLMKKPI